MCSGRVDLEFVFRAFSKGMDGVFIGGCRLNECNYITHGNYHALSLVLLGKKILEQIGLNPERLRIAFMSAGEGNLFAEVTNDFVKKVKEIGPLGQNEGLDEQALKVKLEAVTKLVPYIRLVERERLRVPVQSEEAYHKFFKSDELNKLFNETIADKMVISQIMLLLRERPRSTGELTEILGLNPSEVSRHLNSSSRQGFVRYDEGRQRFVPA
ncbi:MAG: methyl-viologen-reducing hydrogenase subunit delta [Deltaproteobacteria bacterium RBG_13_43_22]|nr:MAG: methyl-viologen-reducing hydrogenase subunit delta [Deltaproteobacteria bacterium RBG_13_43_22]